MQLSYSPLVQAEIINFLSQIENINEASLSRNLCKYLQGSFGSLSQPGWIHSLHYQTLQNKDDSESKNLLSKTLEQFGPRGRLSQIIFHGNIRGNATLEGQQIPLSVYQTLNNHNTALNDQLIKYQNILHKNKGAVDYKNKTLNLSIQQWFLFVIVQSAINSTFISTQIPLQNDDFYHHLTTNPYLILIRKYLLYFRSINSINYQKLIFILKQYTFSDYIFNSKSSIEVYIVPKQIVLYIIYLLIYFERKEFSREDMLDFFKYHMSSKNRGIQAFQSSSLTRLWLYYIRPFDRLENKVIDIALQLDIDNDNQRYMQTQLKRFRPQSILSAPEWNQQYFSIISNYSDLYINNINMAIISMFGRAQFNYKSIHMLATISVLYSPNYQSSIGYIFRTQGKKTLQLAQNQEYIMAQEALKKVKYSLQQLLIPKQTKLTQQSKSIIQIYKEYKQSFEELFYLYDLRESFYFNKQGSQLSQSRSSSTTSFKSTSRIQCVQQQSQWDNQICSHQLRVFYYIWLFLANVLDLVIFGRKFSWRPQTNLRPLCSISVLLISLTLILVLYTSLSLVL